MEEELLGREIYNNIKADVETREPEFDLASKD